MSKISNQPSHRAIGDHQKYLSRITKTLYYGKLPKTESLSLPVTELAAELFSEPQKGKSIRRLHCYDASKISRNACVSPCSLVLAMLYLDRLKKCNPDYLERTAPSDLFLVSLMVSSKFLFDDGESDEVYTDEWAASGGISPKELVALERDFLHAIQWEVYVGEKQFWTQLNDIERALAERQGKSRGFFTYTELDFLLDAQDLYSFLQCFVAVSAILAATYAIGVLSLIGSVSLAARMPGTAFRPSVSSPVKTSANMDAASVFTTGLLLSTLSCDRNCTDNAQDVSWDWWNIPSMNWLADSADIIEPLDVMSYEGTHFMFPEMYPVEMKQLKIEDRLIKATKTRIQDQLENSWHAEWTDTIKYGLFYNRFGLIYNVKS